MPEFDESAGLWTLFVSAFISSTLLPGGSEVLLLYLASEEAHDKISLWLVASTGNTLGGIVSLAMGWWVARRFPGKTLSEEKHRKALHRVRRFGSPTLLFSWLPIVGDPLCFVAGWLKVPWFKAIIFIAIGKMLRYAVLLYLV